MEPPPSPGSSILASPSTKRRRLAADGYTILLTGIAKAGKTTISNRLTQLLKSHDIPVKQIDGKMFADGLAKPTPLRPYFVHLASKSAKMFTEEGYITIISIIAPLLKDRKEARQSHAKVGMRFVEVYVDRDKEESRKETGFDRNVAHAVDDDYQPPTPTQPADIVLNRIGDNMEQLFDSLVMELVHRHVIPSSIQNPSSRMSIPPSSPSSTRSTSGSEGGGFKKPRRKGVLLSIFEQVLVDMRRIGLVGNWDGDTDNPFFMLLMDEWIQHYKSYEGDARFFPVLIPFPKQMTTPTTTPKEGEKAVEKKMQDDFIPVYWDSSDGTIRFGRIQPRGTHPNHAKCCRCWNQATSTGCLCDTHSTTRMTHFSVLLDKSTQNHFYHVAVASTRVKKTLWTKEVGPLEKSLT
ncbi:uncharacterized protein LOC110863275 isoform X1 [Folsomia candida]|uniref:uncharacterized protein LOC110863275 isoform X1 n=2 Tax=Folsomia candida TaxID=158441 RepID=UPI000B8EF193|nr:uncharacterized protein LOC110863275 isoform X1 [Folsomia candida]